MPAWYLILSLLCSINRIHFAHAHDELLVGDHDHDHDHSHDHKGHKCSDHHGSIIKGVNLLQQHVAYKNHPYDKSAQYSNESYVEGQETDNTQRRRTLSESETSPIRVSAYYDPITIGNGLSSK